MHCAEQTALTKSGDVLEFAWKDRACRGTLCPRRRRFAFRQARNGDPKRKRVKQVEQRAAAANSRTP
jgi:hypothetical protein